MNPLPSRVRAVCQVLSLRHEFREEFRSPNKPYILQVHKCLGSKWTIMLFSKSQNLAGFRWIVNRGARGGMWVKNRSSSDLCAFSWALLRSGERSWVCFLSSSALTATWFWVSRSLSPCLCVRCCQNEPTRQSLGDLWVRSVAGMLWFGVYQTWVGGSWGKLALLWVPGHFS